jgi:hypothetical protein
MSVQRNTGVTVMPTEVQDLDLSPEATDTIQLELQWHAPTLLSYAEEDAESGGGPSPDSSDAS